jgi:hypothetical protein
VIETIALIIVIAAAVGWLAALTEGRRPGEMPTGWADR